MFCKGEMVVYPMYGAGVIEDLEERLIDGASQTYYVLKIPVGNLKILVSVNNAENIGIRRVVNSSELEETMGSVKLLPVVMPENWNERYKVNMLKIKTGSLYEATEVFRNLWQRERERGLSSAEKKMLTNVKQIIISEIILSCSVCKTDAEIMLEEFICC